MANSSTGKWVSRVGSSGGGKSYKKSRPGNYYGVVGIICVLGLSSVLYSRYEYQHPVAPVVAQPAMGTTTYAALAVDACGQILGGMPTDIQLPVGFQVQASNVLKISPSKPAEAGPNATVAKFLSEYKAMAFTPKSFMAPQAFGVATSKFAFKNGQLCPAGSKYAGRPGRAIIAYWKTIASKPILTTNAASLHLSSRVLITFAFEPIGVIPQQPTAATVQAMLQAANSSAAPTTSIPVTSSTVSSPTSTLPSTTSTTVHTTTTTSRPTTTTTLRPTTTTLPPATTTTTLPRPT